MLRRPGYYLGPHRDPKRAMLTCLLYLAREGDSEAHGTQIFRVRDDGEASYKQTYYPEDEGPQVRARQGRPIQTEYDAREPELHAVRTAR